MARRAHQPALRTRRLILRPFRMEDAEEVRRLAGHKDVARTTLRIPHPYRRGQAESWIGEHAEGFARGHMAVFAIETRRPRKLVGAVQLDVEPAHRRAELGYWIGKPYWGQGFATEAAAMAIEYGFGSLRLRRIDAHHFLENPASGKVMKKIGMIWEGRLRQHVLKGTQFHDLEVYGILSKEHPAARHRRRHGSGAGACAE